MIDRPEHPQPLLVNQQRFFLQWQSILEEQLIEHLL